MSGGIWSTMDDVDSFVRKYMAYEIVPKKVAQEMDAEYVQAHHATVTSTRAVEFTPDQEFAMAHVSSRGYKRGSPKVYTFVPMDTEIQEWAGYTGWMGYIDRKSDIYIAVTCPQNKAHHPIQLVWRDIYAAMGKKFPEIKK
jgi:hypothetical protein